MGLTVHVVDATIRSDSKYFEELAKVERGDVVIKSGAMCNGNLQVISEIKSRCAPKSISRLIVYGHGAPGIQGLTGKDGAGVREKSGLNLEILQDPAQRSQWRSLRSFFSSDAVMILRGCNTAQGPKGEALIRALAGVLGIPVQASDWYQRVGRTDLIGNVRTAYPSGTIIDDEAQGKRNLLDLPFFERILLRATEYFADPSN